MAYLQEQIFISNLDNVFSDVESLVIKSNYNKETPICNVHSIWKVRDTFGRAYIEDFYRISDHQIEKDHVIWIVSTEFYGSELTKRVVKEYVVTNVEYKDV